MRASDQPKKRSSKFTAGVAAVIVLTALSLRVSQYYSDRHLPVGKVSIRSVDFSVEIASTSGQKELGLGKRDRLARGVGMYFPLTSAGYWVFWMKDMRFPIDIVWIADGKVVDVSPDLPAPKKGEDPVTRSPSRPADAVLELNAGEAAAAGIKPGDEVRLSY